MKITCEHCGATIDVENEKKCGNCGAPYKDNKEYEKVKELKNRHYENELRNEEADIQRKEYENEIRKNAPKTIKTIMLFPILIFCVIAIIMIFLFINFAKSTKETVNTIDPNGNTIDSIKDKLNEWNENTKETEEKELTVSFNENGIMNKFEIICDGVINYDSKYNKKSSDNRQLGLHVIVKNKTDETLVLNDFILTYTDSKGNTGITAKKLYEGLNSQSLSTFLEGGYSAEGYVFYEIPKYVTDIQLHFDKLTINIEDFKSKIK